ncbi:hypothetical protein Tco_0610858 [Tanacetum coccineum]
MSYVSNQDIQEIKEAKEVKKDPTPHELPIVNYYTAPYELHVPYSGRLAQHVKEAFVSKIMESLKEIKVNLPLIKEIKKTDRYAKHMKSLVVNKLRTLREKMLWKTRRGEGLLGPNGISSGKFEEGFGGNVRSCSGNGGRGGFIAGRGGGSLAKRLMKSKDGLAGEGFVILGGRSSKYLDGWVGAGGGEVKGGGVDFGVSRTLLGEIPREIIGESSGEAFGFDGGAVR